MKVASSQCNGILASLDFLSLQEVSHLPGWFFMWLEHLFSQCRGLKIVVFLLGNWFPRANIPKTRKWKPPSFCGSHLKTGAASLPADSICQSRQKTLAEIRAKELDPLNGTNVKPLWLPSTSHSNRLFTLVCFVL